MMHQIYIIKLKPDANIFDAKNYLDFANLSSYPDEVKDFLNFTRYDEKKDIFSRFKDIIINYPEIEKANFNKDDYFDDQKMKWEGLQIGYYEREIQPRQELIFAAVEFFRKNHPDIFASGSTWDKMVKMREAFCKDLKKAGY